jgi:hypothetical protein
MIEIVNCTPHALTICGKTFEPSGIIPRVEMLTVDMGQYAGFPAIAQFRVSVVGLPEARPGVFLVVSGMAFSAVDEKRIDVIAPDTGETAIRNEKGHIIAVTRIICKEPKNV